MKARKFLGAAAVALAAGGLLGACAPPPAPTPVVPPTGPTDTKTFSLTCQVYVPSISLTTTSSNSATITLAGTDPTTSGTGVDFTVDITGGIKNGPVASTDGTVEVFTSLNGAPAVQTADTVFGATAASAFVAVPQLSGTTDPIAAESTVHLTKITYTANAPSGVAYGTCNIAAGDQPGILIGVA